MQPERSLLEIQAKIKLLAQKNTPNRVNEASLLEECLGLKEAYEEQKRKLKSLDDLVVKLGEMNGSRRDNYVSLRNCITKIIRRQFYLMAKEVCRFIVLTLGTIFIFISISV